MLSLLDHTRVGLPDHSERKACWSCHPRYDKRPDERLRHFYRKYARRLADAHSKGGVKTRQYRPNWMILPFVIRFIMADLHLILQNPLKQLVVFHLACRDGKTDACDLGIGGAKLDAVSFKECEKNVHSDSLISVNKGVV